jgi:peptide/nickel transport system permease protein
MAAFFVRRIIGAILVCIAVTFVVFVIFIIAPGGGKRGTAERIAGKNASPNLVLRVEHQWGFDRPFYVQYAKLMQRMFTNKLVSYTSQVPVLSQIWQDMPATFS